MIWRVMVAVVAALMLAGCLPVLSTHPVGTTTGLGADPALYGSWKGHDVRVAGQPESYLHLLKASDGAITAVMAFAHGQQDDEFTIYRLRTAKVGPNRMMNVEMADERGKATPQLKGAVFPIFYRIEGRTLRLFLVDIDKIKAAIEAGKIEGRSEKGKDGDAVITAAPAALDAFFARPETAGLYQPMGVFQRVE